MSDFIETKHLNDLKKAMMTCTYCGFCKSVCPVFEDIRWDPSVARGRVILSYGLYNKDIPPDESVMETIYQCTTCKDCERRCPSSIEVVDIVESCRKDLVENEVMLPKHRKIVDSILKYRNPYGEEKRVLEAMEAEPRRAKVGYFVGCTAAHRNREIADATVSILEKTGTDFTLVDEVCCGSVMQRIGWNDEDLKELMEENIQAIQEQGVGEVVFSCAGCYRMFKEEYPKFVEVPFEVKHVSELLADMDLKLSPLEGKVTYHDPCHLGRHCGVYEAPREVLRKIPGLDLKEMSRNRDASRCCGGGGGVRSAYPELSGQIASGRMKEGEIAEIMVSTCPFCVNNLRMGGEKQGNRVEVKDLVELLDELLEGP
ncbi:MAG: (Fe-S)-binding protein [Methanomassiliicoccales archaeon]